MEKVPDIDTFGSTHDRKIQVQSVPGFLAAVALVARVKLPAEVAWELLTHPENPKIFRGITRAGKRRILVNQRHEQKYEVEHYTGWRVLWMSGEFCATLRVTQRPYAGEVKFELLASDVMSAFDGSWTIKPFTQDSLNKLYGKRMTWNPVSHLQGFFAARATSESLLELDQKVQPKSVPPPLRGMVRRIAANSIKQVLEDIETEAEKIRKGEATIPELNRFSKRLRNGEAHAPQAYGSMKQSWHGLAYARVGGVQLCRRLCKERERQKKKKKKKKKKIGRAQV
eukprot:TRINITY_DN27172_c0_g2_i1.p1 TRINITY_DN27172_c0_g2~~TRINITY_DN27172_c0_g2_i1.p1  ORF type:complete len:283 (-),score=33.72 TRINITY_DN27172_c0_g2_i1:62-910(-)